MVTGYHLNKGKILVKKSKPRGRIQKNPIVESYIKIPDPKIVIKKKKVVILIIETISKIYELGSYYEAVLNNPIYGRYWREAIKK